MNSSLLAFEKNQQQIQQAINQQLLE